jgi:D-beta-D-heptose 7-phosphate kinase / D-beta-D-heptose 1-phosphate adenosyltransferase
MNESLLDTIARFGAQRVLVIGDAMLDAYMTGVADRICREAPVPIVSVSQTEYRPGGAANTAMNAHALGAQTRFLSVAGDDSDADILLTAMRITGIDVDGVACARQRSTLSKRRILADGHLLMRFDQGTSIEIDSEQECRLLDSLGDGHAWCDAIVVSDYGYGILTPAVRHRLRLLQRRSPRIVAVDAKNFGLYRELGIQAIKPNRGEALALLGGRANGSSDVEYLMLNGEKILDQTGASLAAVTLDRDGAVILERGRTPHRVFARAPASASTAGAGDTYIAALTVALAAGASAPTAAEMAGAAADTVVAKDGTAVCSLSELQLTLSSADKRLAGLDEIGRQVAADRASGRKLVMTSGCFDILHRGHVSFLSQAKSLGDILVVALNTDASVRQLKGPGRPINPMEDRAQILAAMSCVDYVVPFEEETPIELIRALSPDYYAKGGDYVREKLPEGVAVEQAGGEVIILPYVNDLSTSRVIDRVRRSAPTLREPFNSDSTSAAEAAPNQSDSVRSLLS